MRVDTVQADRSMLSPPPALKLTPTSHSVNPSQAIGPRTPAASAGQSSPAMASFGSRGSKRSRDSDLWRQEWAWRSPPLSSQHESESQASGVGSNVSGRDMPTAIDGLTEALFASLFDVTLQRVVEDEPIQVVVEEHGSSRGEVDDAAGFDDAASSDHAASFHEYGDEEEGSGAPPSSSWADILGGGRPAHAPSSSEQAGRPRVSHPAGSLLARL